MFHGGISQHFKHTFIQIYYRGIQNNSRKSSRKYLIHVSSLFNIENHKCIVFNIKNHSVKDTILHLKKKKVTTVNTNDLTPICPKIAFNPLDTGDLHVPLSMTH